MPTQSTLGLEHVPILLQRGWLENGGTTVSMRQREDSRCQPSQAFIRNQFCRDHCSHGWQPSIIWPRKRRKQLMCSSQVSRSMSTDPGSLSASPPDWQQWQLAAKIPRLDKWLHMSRQRYGYTELLEDTVVRFIFVVFITVQITLADLEKINFQSFLPSMSPFLINFCWSGLKTNVAAKGPVPGALLWASVLQRLAKPQGSSARPRQPQAARNLCTRGVQTQLQMSSGPSTNTQKGQGTVARKEPMERSWQQLLCSKRRRAEWHFSMSCRDLRWDPILKG